MILQMISLCWFWPKELSICFEYIQFIFCTDDRDVSQNYYLIIKPKFVISAGNNTFIKDTVKDIKDKSVDKSLIYKVFFVYFLNICLFSVVFLLLSFHTNSSELLFGKLKQFPSLLYQIFLGITGGVIKHILKKSV